MENIKRVFLSAVVMMFLTASIPAFAGNVSVSLTDLDNVTVKQDEQGYPIFNGDAISLTSVPGEPSLPYRNYNILLPPEADLSSVYVEIVNKTEVTENGKFFVKPASVPVARIDNTIVEDWPEGRHIIDGRAQEIYKGTAFFPENSLISISPGEIRGWKVVRVSVCVFRYDPAHNTLFKLTAGDLSVNYESTLPDLQSSASSAGSDNIAVEMVRNTVSNFDSASSYYGIYPSMRSSEVQASEGYAIITTSSVISDSTKLDNFIKWKESKGYSVYVKVENDWGGGNGDEAAENIRQWLRNNYQSLNLKYVLLIGDPDPSNGDVPMKMLYPRNNSDSYTDDPDYVRSPSDLYYADLTGDWDADNDGFYGEGDDDMVSGGIDLNWELYVGRIPFYGSFSDLDAILQKIINYESTSVESAQWRKNILLPMEPSDESTPGYHLGEAIKDDLLPSDWSYYRVYDQNYGLYPSPEKTPCSVSNVTNSWNSSSFGTAVWWTHGSQTSAADIMDISHTGSLDDFRPSVVFQVSCLNAYPENSSNLSYSLLKNGSIAAIGASRVSWYSKGQTIFSNSNTNTGLAYDFTRELVSEGKTIGEALFAVKEDSCSINAWWMNYTDFNLYGDPSLYLIDPSEDGYHWISGTVLTDNGSALSNASVQIRGENILKTAETDYRGQFLVEVPSGNYDVSVVKTEWEIDPDRRSINVENSDVELEEFTAQPSETTDKTTDTVSTSGGGGGGGCSTGTFPASAIFILMPLLVILRKNRISRQ